MHGYTVILLLLQVLSRIVVRFCQQRGNTGQAHPRSSPILANDLRLYTYQPLLTQRLSALLDPHPDPIAPEPADRPFAKSLLQCVAKLLQTDLGFGVSILQ